MLELTDQEIGFISLALAKVDPTGIMAEAASIQRKIADYARQKQERQMGEVAALQTDEVAEAPES